MQMQMWLVDHYDSFTLNLRDWLIAHPAVDCVRIVPYDDPIGMQAVAMDISPIVLSAGPNDPSSVKPTMDLMRNIEGGRPVLGICLGHQLLGVLHGGHLKRAQVPQHGSSRVLRLFETEWRSRFADDPMVAVYHSLVLDGETLQGVRVLALDDDGDVMAIASENSLRPFLGWQFHPESFLTVEREVWCEIWIDFCRKFEFGTPMRGGSNDRD